MTVETERQHIEEEFAATWVSTTTPIRYSNVAGLVNGTTMVKDSTGLSQWCRLQIVNTTSDNAVVGGSVVRHEGFIVVNIFVKSGTGLATARQLCDSAKAIFNNKQFDGINCQASFITTEGEEEGFYQMSVTTPYYRDE